MPEKLNAPDMPLTEATWRRVHPLTPVMRSWRTVAALIALISLRSEDILRSAFEKVTGTSDPARTRSSSGFHPNTTLVLLVVGGLLGALAVLLFLNWISWRATSFRITDNGIEVRRGVIVKQHRNARLDRVQAIDVVQPLLPRLLGLAALSFDVAGSESASLRISMLKHREAEELREAMLTRVRSSQAQSRSSSNPDAQRTTTSEGAPNPGAASELASETHDHTSTASRQPRTLGAQLVRNLAREGLAVGEDFTATLTSTFAAYDAHPRLGRDGHIVHVPPHRILAASALRPSSLFAFAWFFFGIGALIVGIHTGNSGAGWSIAFTALLTAISILHSLLQTVLRQANFSASLTAGGLLITQGVTTTERRIIPLDRIQAVGIEQPLLWRPFGWWRAHYNIAARGNTTAGNEANILLPVGSLDDALAMLTLALPLRPDGQRDTELTGALLHDAAAPKPSELRRQPRSSRWLDPLSWRCNGWRHTSSVVLIRQGRFKRRIAILPLARVQSLAEHDGPLQRRLHLASISLHSTKGPVESTITHQEITAARRLFFELAAITSEARRAEQARAFGAPSD